MPPVFGTLTLLWHGSIVAARLLADGTWDYPEDALRGVLTAHFGPDRFSSLPDQLNAAAERLAGSVTLAAETS